MSAVASDGESRWAFAQFREAVAAARDAMGMQPAPAGVIGAYAAHDCLYRGHASELYTLQPTLLRLWQQGGGRIVTRETRPAEATTILRELQDLESQLFYEFAPRGRKLAPNVQGDWDMLALMRHHGVATRLLDWSQSFGVALYFALSPWCDDRGRRDRAFAPEVAWPQPSLWLLNPLRLNRKSWRLEDIVAPRFLVGDDDDAESTYGDWLGDGDDPGMDWEEPVAIYPEVLNDRLNAQHGLFTVHGDLHEPLDQLVGADIVRRVPLPLAALPAALEFLDDAGIRESTVFPDLDALARDLNRKYRLV